MKQKIEINTRKKQPKSKTSATVSSDFELTYSRYRLMSLYDTVGLK